MVTDLGESGVKGREKINKNAIVYIISHTCPGIGLNGDGLGRERRKGTGKNK